MVNSMKEQSFRFFSFLVMLFALSGSVLAQTSSAARYDSQIQQAITRQLHEKKEFCNVQSRVEDGIATLAGTVNVYQEKLDAAKKVRKAHNVQGVRNLIQVSSTVPDPELRQKLSKKLYYERVGYYDNAFNYFTLAVKDGVVTVGGETYNDVARDYALATIQRMEGVKDLIDEIKVAPVSLFDDDLRVRAARAIYRDSVLGRYAIDPARPIRIIVNNGNISLYGTVDSLMDKEVAGIRIGSVPGAFSVQNNLTVAGQSNSGM
jgi:hyperosmotically inducible periplasmic protein